MSYDKEIVLKHSKEVYWHCLARSTSVLRTSVREKYSQTMDSVWPFSNITQIFM